MKSYSRLIPILFILFISCNNDSSTTANSTSDGNISESVLPKGQYVVQDETSVKNNTADVGATSGIGDTPKNADPENAANPTNELKRRYKNLLVFHAADTMKIKKSYVATLILGKDQLLSDIKAEVLEQSGAKQDDKITKDTTLEIGTRMSAKLTDMSDATDKGFEIEFLGAGGPEQGISEKHKRAVWQWKLTPKSPGMHDLLLVVSVTEDGNMVNLPTRKIPVVIFAEKQSFLSQVGDFFNDPNAKWIVTAILIPILIAWFTTRMKHKSEMSRFQNSNNNANNTTAAGSGQQPTNTTASNNVFRKNHRRQNK